MQVYGFLKTNKLLIPSQFGFREICLPLLLLQDLRILFRLHRYWSANGDGFLEFVSVDTVNQFSINFERNSSGRTRIHSQDLLQVVNFTGLLQIVNKLQQACQFHQVAASLFKITNLTTCNKLVVKSCREPCERILISACCYKLLQDVNSLVVTWAFLAVYTDLYAGACSAWLFNQSCRITANVLDN